MKQYRIPAIVLFSLLLVSSLVFLGCEVGSSDSAVRNIGLDFSGFYDSTGTNSAFVTPANSGARVTSFNLRQSGDLLEAIDNNNIVFHGTVGDPSGSSGTGTSSFQLEGYTTAGQPVTISGTLSGANTGGNSASATIDGTWIEPNLYARILGDAIINSIQSNAPGAFTLTVAVSPAGAGTVTPASGSTFSSGSSVTVTATPAAGHSFSNWTGNLSGTANPSTITMDANKSITANFN